MYITKRLLVWFCFDLLQKVLVLNHWQSSANKKKCVCFISDEPCRLVIEIWSCDHTVIRLLIRALRTYQRIVLTTKKTNTQINLLTEDHIKTNYTFKGQINQNRPIVVWKNPTLPLHLGLSPSKRSSSGPKKVIAAQRPNWICYVHNYYYYWSVFKPHFNPLSMQQKPTCTPDPPLHPPYTNFFPTWQTGSENNSWKRSTYCRFFPLPSLQRFFHLVKRFTATFLRTKAKRWYTLRENGSVRSFCFRGLKTEQTLLHLCFNICIFLW